MNEQRTNFSSDFVGTVLSSLGRSTGAAGATVENIRETADVRDGYTATAIPSGTCLPTIDASQIRAVFFDLDGTLLPMDLDEFLERYFSRIAQFVQEKGLDTQAFSAGFSSGMKAMGHHDPNQTNCEAFWDAFFKHVDGAVDNWMQTLEEFYTSVFPEIGADVRADPACARAVKAFADRGYPVVLATMPYFPVAAVHARLKWAGVDENLFARITHYENSRAAKPSTYYYAENLAACGLSGSEVLMVGNNTVEDLSFAELGAHVYLTTDWLLNPNNMDFSDIPHGAMAELADWAATLPACAAPARDIATGCIDRAIVEDALAAGGNLCALQGAASR